MEKNENKVIFGIVNQIGYYKKFEVSISFVKRQYFEFCCIYIKKRKLTKNSKTDRPGIEPESPR